MRCKLQKILGFLSRSHMTQAVDIHKKINQLIKDTVFPCDAPVILPFQIDPIAKSSQAVALQRGICQTEFCAVSPHQYHNRHSKQCGQHTQCGSHNERHGCRPHLLCLRQ